MIRTLKLLMFNCNEVCETRKSPLLHTCGLLLVFRRTFSSLERVLTEKGSLEIEHEVTPGYNLNLKFNGGKEIINREMRQKDRLERTSW